MAVKVNIRSRILIKELTGGTNKAAASRFMAMAARRSIKAARDVFENEFDAHKFTQEIKAGATTENSSGSLQGYGNLYSFIGFDQTKPNPIERLREKLFGNFKVSAKRKRFAWYEIQTNIPDAKTIKADPEFYIPWQEGRSWIDGLEKGISGLGYYLYDPKRFTSSPISRSGAAIQAKKWNDPSQPFKIGATRSKSGTGKFKNGAYLTAMFKRFVRNIKKKQPAGMNFNG